MGLFQIEGEEVIEKVVRNRPRGSSAQIYLHKKYAGRHVKVVILPQKNNKGVKGDEGEGELA